MAALDAERWLTAQQGHPDAAARSAPGSRGSDRLGGYARRRGRDLDRPARPHAEESPEARAGSPSAGFRCAVPRPPSRAGGRAATRGRAAESVRSPPVAGAPARGGRVYYQEIDLVLTAKGWSPCARPRRAEAVRPEALDARRDREDDSTGHDRLPPRRRGRGGRTSTSSTTLDEEIDELEATSTIGRPSESGADLRVRHELLRSDGRSHRRATPSARSSTTGSRSRTARSSTAGSRSRSARSTTSCCGRRRAWTSRATCWAACATTRSRRSRAIRTRRRSG